MELSLAFQYEKIEQLRRDLEAATAKRDALLAEVARANEVLTIEQSGNASMVESDTIEGIVID